MLPISLSTILITTITNILNICNCLYNIQDIKYLKHDDDIGKFKYNSPTILECGYCKKKLISDTVIFCYNDNYFCSESCRNSCLI